MPENKLLNDPNVNKNRKSVAKRVHRKQRGFWRETIRNFGEILEFLRKTENSKDAAQATSGSGQN